MTHLSCSFSFQPAEVVDDDTFCVAPVVIYSLCHQYKIIKNLEQTISYKTYGCDRFTLMHWKHLFPKETVDIYSLSLPLTNTAWRVNVVRCVISSVLFEFKVNQTLRFLTFAKFLKKPAGGRDGNRRPSAGCWKTLANRKC